MKKKKRLESQGTIRKTDLVDVSLMIPSILMQGTTKKKIIEIEAEVEIIEK